MSTERDKAAGRIADDLPYRIVEEMGLGLTFRSCSCGQLPCARLRPLRDALAAARAEGERVAWGKAVAIAKTHNARHDASHSYARGFATAKKLIIGALERSAEGETNQ